MIRVVKKSSPRNRAFTLVELLFTISIIAVSSAITIPLIRWSVTTMHSSQRHATTTLQDHIALDQLRADVWQAARLSAPDPHQLLLTSIDGKTSRWQLGPGETICRAGPSEKLPASDAKSLTVQVDRSTVLLIYPASHDTREKTLSLISQAALLNEGAR